MSTRKNTLEERWETRVEINLSTTNNDLFQEWQRIEEYERKTDVYLSLIPSRHYGSILNEVSVYMDLGGDIDPYLPELERFKDACGTGLEMGWLPRRWFALLGAKLEGMVESDPNYLTTQRALGVVIEAWRREALSIDDIFSRAEEIGVLVAWGKIPDSEQLISEIQSRLRNVLPDYDLFSTISDSENISKVASFVRGATNSGYADKVQELHVYLRDALKYIDVTQVDEDVVEKLLTYIAICGDLSDQNKMAIADEVATKMGMNEGLMSIYRSVGRFDLMLRQYKTRPRRYASTLIKYAYQHGLLDEVRKLKNEYLAAKDDESDWYFGWYIALITFENIMSDVWNLPEILQFVKNHSWGTDVLGKIRNMRPDHEVAKAVRNRLGDKMSRHKSGELVAHDIQTLIREIADYKMIFGSYLGR